MSKHSWFSMKAAGDSADITILSEIGGFGMGAQQFHDSLRALGQPKEIRISISSDGGDVSAGFAIFNMLNRHPANKVVTIEGLAASMASVVAMAGDTIIMPSNAQMMIHNPWGAIVAGAEQIASFAEALKTMQTNIANTYKARTGLTLGTIRQMMAKETWLSAKAAVEKGFADRIEKPLAINARATFNLSRFTKVPKKFGRSLKESTMTKRNEDEIDGDGDEAVKSEADIRKEILAEHSEVRALCKLAGKPDKAEEYIAANKTRAQVMDALAKAAEEDDDEKDDDDADKKKKEKDKDKKKSKDSSEISTRNNPQNRGSDTGAEIDSPAIWAKWNSAGKRKVA